MPPTLQGSDAALGDHGRDHHNNMIIIYMHIYIIIWRHRTDLYVTKRNYENLFFICVSDDERCCLLCDLIGWFVSYCSAGVGNWRPAGHNWPARHYIWPARLFWSYMILFFIFLYRISISVSLNVKGRIQWTLFSFTTVFEFKLIKSCCYSLNVRDTLTRKLRGAEREILVTMQY